MAGATHRINFVSNFSQSDAGIKQMIEDLRVMGQIAEAAGDKGSEGARRFFAALGNLDSKATTTSRQFATMNTLLAEMEMQWNRMGDAAKKNAGAELQKSIEQVRAKVEGLNKELQGIGAGANIGGAAGKGGGLFGKIMGGNLAARAVMDSLRFVKDTVKDAVQANMEFEYSNATLSAVLGKTKEEIMDLTIQAQKLGSTSLYSAKEISELQIVLARLGFNQTEIKDSTDAIAKLALATGVDLEKAATLTGSTLRAFGYSTKEAARVASVLGVATTKSALDMSKLSTAMAYASSVARQAGFEIEDVVAMLGKMVDNGQQATTAGVNMRNIMLDLSNKSSKLSRAIKEVTGKDQVKNFDEFVDALRQMRDAGINLDDVANVVQKRVTPGFLNMIANTDGIAQLRDELKGCTGELDAMADKMENTLQGSVTKLGNAWNGLMLSFNNSKGVLKGVTDALGSLLNAWAELNNRNFATQEAGIASYENGISGETASILDKRLEERLASGVSEDAIRRGAEGRIAELEKQKKDLQKAWNDFQAALDGDWKTKANARAALETALGFSLQGKNEKQSFYQAMALRNEQIAQQQYYIGKLPSSIAAQSGGTSDSIREGAGLGLGDKLTNAMTDAEKAEQRVNDALVDYETAIRKAALEKEVGYINEEQYTKKVLQAEERLFGVYSDVAATIGDPDYKKNVENEAQRIRELAESAEELRRAREEAAEAEREEARKLREQKNYDMRILRGLQSTTNRAKLGYDEVGLSGVGERIAQGVDISNDEWVRIQNTINAKLKGLNLDPIRIDFETGSIEKLKSDLNIFKDELGAMSGIVGGLSNIKSTITDIASAFEEGKDPLDTFFSIFESGISLMQTGIAIYEAINKLQEISTVLKEAHSAAEAKDTIVTLANAAAKGTEASATGAAAAAEGAKSVAGIPFVGPVLAVAAIAAIAAAIASSRSDTEYHAGGGFAGMDGMRPKGTDVVPAMLTPGELVLNRAQQNNLAGQLEGVGRNMVLVQGESYVSGEQIRIVYNNYSKRRGVKSQLA